MAKMLTFDRTPEPAPPPTDEELQEVLDRMVTSELAQFADTLEAARVLWRMYPELVEGTEFPEYLRQAYRDENDAEVEGVCDYGSPHIEEVRASVLPDALDFVARRQHRAVSVSHLTH